MSAKIKVTYKRKHGAAKARAADGRIPEPPPVSGGGVASSEAQKQGVDADNNVLNGDDPSTCTKQQDASKLIQENAKKETAKPCGHASEKERKDIQLHESLPRDGRPEICCATSLPVAEASNDKLQCTSDAFNPITSPSYACDLRHDGGENNQPEDSNNSAPAGITYKAPDDTTRPSECKNKFSPLLTFRRRVKRKINLDGPAEENCSKDNDKRCSTLTCSPPSLLVNATHLMKETGGNSLDTTYKVTIAGTSTGLNVPAQCLLEQKSSYMLKSAAQPMVSPQHAGDVNQSITSECDGTLVSEFTSVQEISKQDVTAEDLSKTLDHVSEAPEVVEMKELHDGPLESEGSTKHIPVIVLDGDNDESGKLLENSKVPDQVVQENKKDEFTSGKINLNCVELPQEKLLDLHDLSVQRLPNQGHFATEQKQVSQPIERLFFTEKDTIHAKEKHQEGTSKLHTLYSNFFDPTPSWKAGSSKEPKSMPSELKFRIMDKVPEFSLDLSLDNFQDSGMSALGHSKLFHGGKSSGSHLLTERLGTYSYRRRQAPWSEEELDFLWIGVRRYGINNWNAMMRDTRLRFSSSRVAEDLAKQWDKEQKKLLGQSIRTSALLPAPPPHMAEDYVGSSSCSGCSKPPFLAAQTNLSMGDVYLRNARASDRGQHHLSNLGRYNVPGIDNGSSLGSFPVASSSHGKSGSRRRKTSKLHKSYYDNRSQYWCQGVPEKMSSQPFPMNQQPFSSNLPQWLTKDVEPGKSWLKPEMWPSTQAPRHSGADSLNDSLRAAAFLFPHEKKPHDMAAASLKHELKRKAEWHTTDKKLFRTGDDALDLNPEATVMAAGLNRATASDTGASSEETVSDS